MRSQEAERVARHKHGRQTSTRFDERSEASGLCRAARILSKVQLPSVWNPMTPQQD